MKMKKILLLAMVPALLLACSDHKNEPGHKHDDHAKVEGIQLNNGKKWNADESTAAKADVLLSIMENMSLYKNKTHQVYVNTAIELETTQERLVRECRMKGDDHDALHRWLEPLMKKTADLKNSKGVEEASRIFDDIHQHVKLFNQYFE